jgi:hypothetical protein
MHHHPSLLYTLVLVQFCEPLRRPLLLCSLVAHSLFTSVFVVFIAPFVSSLRFFVPCPFAQPTFQQESTTCNGSSSQDWRNRRHDRRGSSHRGENGVDRVWGGVYSSPSLGVGSAIAVIDGHPWGRVGKPPISRISLFTFFKASSLRSSDVTSD